MTRWECCGCHRILEMFEDCDCPETQKMREDRKERDCPK